MFLQISDPLMPRFQCMVEMRTKDVDVISSRRIQDRMFTQLFVAVVEEELLQMLHLWLLLRATIIRHLDARLQRHKCKLLVQSEFQDVPLRQNQPKQVEQVNF